MVCLTRPELFEQRPAWMASNPNSGMVLLGALTDAESDGLITNLVGGADVPPSVRTRIAEVAEGNPLFVEETLRMLVDDGLLEPIDGSWAVTADISGLSIPTTIQTLLSARLDRLPEAERAVLERASVIGRVFWWSALEALSPEPQREGWRVRSSPPYGRSCSVPTERSYVNRTLSGSRTIERDAAYFGIPKAMRADLHESLVDWFEGKVLDRTGDLESILGHHLRKRTRRCSIWVRGTNERTWSPAGRAHCLRLPVDRLSRAATCLPR